MGCSTSAAGSAGGGSGSGSAAAAGRLRLRLRLRLGLGLGLDVVDRRLQALLRGHLVVVLLDGVGVEGLRSGGLGGCLRGHGLVGDRGGRRIATGGAQRLVLEAGDLAGVGAVAPLELEMFLDRVVEQSHGSPKP